MPLGMAAQWESRRGPAGGAALAACVIVARESAGVVRQIHGRMPTTIAPADYDVWLDRATADVAALGALLTGAD